MIDADTERVQIDAKRAQAEVDLRRRAELGDVDATAQIVLASTERPLMPLEFEETAMPSGLIGFGGRSIYAVNAAYVVPAAAIAVQLGESKTEKELPVHLRGRAPEDVERDAKLVAELESIYAGTEAARGDATVTDPDVEFANVRGERSAAALVVPPLPELPTVSLRAAAESEQVRCAKLWIGRVFA